MPGKISITVRTMPRRALKVICYLPERLRLRGAAQEPLPARIAFGVSMHQVDGGVLADGDGGDHRRSGLAVASAVGRVAYVDPWVRGSVWAVAVTRAQLCDPCVECYADARDEVLGGLVSVHVLDNLVHFPDGGLESVHPGHNVVHGTFDPDSTIDWVVWEVGLLLEHGNPERIVLICVSSLFSWKPLLAVSVASHEASSWVHNI